MHKIAQRRKIIVLALGAMAGCVWLYTAFGLEDSSADHAPTEDPPRILVAAEIDPEERLLLISYHSIFIGFSGEAYNERLTTKVPLKDVRITTVGGKSISLKTAREKIAGRDTPIIVTSFKSQLPKFYMAMFSPDTLHFAFPARAPQWREIEAPGALVK